MQGSNLPGSTGFASWIGVESVAASRELANMNLSNRGSSECSLI